MELLKAVLFGIVEGVTEWLPISSTGHLILLNEFITLNVSDEFRSMFDVVIQLGAILAVIVLFFHKLNPFSPTKSEGEKKQTWQLWFKVIAAIIPSGIVGVLFDDWMEAHFHNATVVSIALIVYGVAFILVERRNARRVGGKTVEDVYAIDYKTALLIGCFQCLSLIPGTSRSGSTMAAGLLRGINQQAALDYSFVLGIPSILAAAVLTIKDAIGQPVDIGVGAMIAGVVTAAVVGFLAIKLLKWIVTTNKLQVFAYYTLVLGVITLIVSVIEAVTGTNLFTGMPL